MILKPFLLGGQMTKSKRVLGIGINDSEYPVNRYELIDGVRRRIWACKFYGVWSNMLNRCYSASYQALYPTYAGCSVSEDWHLFSEFRSWMSSKEWQNKHLDKDILHPGNKIYSSDECVFVDAKTNIFLIDSGASRGDWPIGVHWVTREGKFQASCRNPFSDKQESLGLFDCPYAAHEAWRACKHRHALSLAKIQSDPRVAIALAGRYSKEAI